MHSSSARIVFYCVMERASGDRHGEKTKIRKTGVGS